MLTIPFTPTKQPKKGVAHEPGGQGMIDPKTQETLLRAIARARGWMDAILAGKSKSFEEIAATENLAERHVLRLAPLAFLSPRLVEAIADGRAQADLTVSLLTQRLPHSWREQEQLFAVS